VTGVTTSDPSEVGPAAEARGAGVRGILFDYLRLFGLCGLALLSPLLDSLQEGPTFFVAQGMSGVDVVLFLAFWAFVPPLVALVPVVLARLVSRRAADTAMAVVAGILVGFAVLGLVSSSHSWRSVVFVTVLAAIAAGFAFVYRRFRNLRTFVTALAVAPVLVIVTFVSAPGVSDVVFPAAAAGEGVTRNDTPVVMVIFDELSLGALLRPDGTIDEVSYPNFARLAGTSTWYPEAKSVSPWTNLAVPAITSGALPVVDRVPSASAWPRTVFSLFGNSGGNVLAHESTTALCPEDVCDVPTRLRWGQVLSDSWSVVGNSVLTAGMADRWFSPLGDTWAGLGADDGLTGLEELTPTEFHQRWQDENSGSDDPPVALAQFVAEVPSLGAGDLGYIHFHLPHWPFQFLPDGTRYNGSQAPYWFDGRNLGADASGQVTVRQREMLQTMYADTVLGELLDRLDDTELGHDAMVVVAADHGISLEPSAMRRSAADMTSTSVDDTMAVPLFVRYPGQTAGTVDERDARTIDIFPTILEVTEAQVGSTWEVDGTSLLSDPVEGRPLWWLSNTSEEVASVPDATRTANRYWSVLGSRAMQGEPFAIGPHADLMGADVDVLEPGNTAAACAFESTPWSAYEPSSAVYPALVSATTDLPSGTWVLAGVNGRVAGMGPSFVDPKGVSRVDVMVGPDSMQAGSNQVELYAIAADGNVVRLGCA
jgi:hypothetical protein